MLARPSGLFTTSNFMANEVEDAMRQSNNTVDYALKHDDSVFRVIARRVATWQSGFHVDYAPKYDDPDTLLLFVGLVLY
jgi:hypothetical protein